MKTQEQIVAEFYEKMERIKAEREERLRKIKRTERLMIAGAISLPIVIIAVSVLVAWLKGAL